MTQQPIRRILVTGAAGQIGSELTMALRQKYGAQNVLATDINPKPSADLLETGPYELISILDPDSLAHIAYRYDIDAIFHLAAILSATAEGNPDFAWNVNINGLKNVLDIARQKKMSRVIVPSSIAVFGPSTPKENAPQDTVLRPSTMYGVTKAAGELLCDYYCMKYDLDVRGIRYPGLISWKTEPGGGTTDYAVSIFYSAVKGEPFSCFVKPETVLPMMYMPDAVKAMLQLAEADGQTLTHRNAYNLAAFSFSARELEETIRRHIPGLSVTYDPDYHQAIADGWPSTIDDSAARHDWGWQPDYDLDAMTRDMIENLRRKLG
ncbi:MAG: NAD-dependent epimerase/dehydratase family protein [Rhodothermales bacterium]|nr:NAD-dependent epimerase/dehydratase family protein [Rhodothermales bacterium]